MTKGFLYVVQREFVKFSVWGSKPVGWWSWGLDSSNEFLGGGGVARSGSCDKLSMLHGWVFPETSQRSDILSTLDGDV